MLVSEAAAIDNGLDNHIVFTSANAGVVILNDQQLQDAIAERRVTTVNVTVDPAVSADSNDEDDPIPVLCSK